MRSNVIGGNEKVTANAAHFKHIGGVGRAHPPPLKGESRIIFHVFKLLSERGRCYLIKGGIATWETARVFGALRHHIVIHQSDHREDARYRRKRQWALNHGWPQTAEL